MRFFLIFLLILACFIANVDAQEANIDYEFEVSRICRNLQSRQYRNRLNAANQLEDLPNDANQYLLKKLDELDIRSRLIIIDVLTNKKDINVVHYITNNLNTFNVIYDSRLANACRKFNYNAWEIIKEKTIDQRFEDLNRRFEDFKFLFVKNELIERFYEVYEIALYRSYSFNKFNPLLLYENYSLKVLKKIVLQPNEFLNNFKSYRYYIREVALRLISDSKLNGTYQILQDIKTELQITTAGLNLYNFQREERRLIDLIDFLAYTYNYKFEAMLMINSLKLEMRYFGEEEKIYLEIQLGNIYMLINEYQKAIDIFNNIIKKINNDQERRDVLINISYKLLTIYSLRNEIDLAMDMLKFLIENHYTDLDWVYRDYNLLRLWNTNEFKIFMNELKEREIYKEYFPQFEPGERD